MSEEATVREAEARHPATYSESIILAIEDALFAHVGRSFTAPPPKGLDSMAGTGKLFDRIPWCDWRGVDLEVWADQDPRVVIGDATKLKYASESFDFGVVSPTYGNGFADHHIPKDTSIRVSYFHRLRAAGRVMDARNSGWFHFGPRGSRRETARYKLIHIKAWREMYRVLRWGGYFLLNVKNFYAANELVDVASWHREACEKIGFQLVDTIKVPVPGLKYGDDKTLKREEFEYLFVFHKVPR